MTDLIVPARGANGRFVCGNPGRPAGARNRVSGRVARMVLEDFEAHSAELLPRLRQWFVPQYIQLIVRLLPRPTEAPGSELDDLTDAELATVLAEVRTTLDRIEAGEAPPVALEAAVLPPATVNYGEIR